MKQYQHSYKISAAYLSKKMVKSHLFKYFMFKKNSIQLQINYLILNSLTRIVLCMLSL